MFPEELTHFKQWVCWKYALTADGKPTKLPYSARGTLASVADPLSWSDYATVVHAATASNFYSGIGFVLTDNDPFCFIDLDDPGDDVELSRRHVAIAEAFDTYSEVSPSGKGLHLILKGSVPEGCRRNKVEIYSSRRYMTMTGLTYHSKPIAERNLLAQQLWVELRSNNGGGNAIEQRVNDQPQKYTDDVIYNIAASADNGQKFCDLWRGDWQQHYASQSEADFAMINMLGFYSRNIEQIDRMFRLCSLGKRKKAERKQYVFNMIKRSFDNLPPAIDLSEMVSKVAAQVIAAEKEKAEHTNPFAGPLFADVPDPAYDWTMPPGLLGEITQFIYNAAPRPVKEVALAAAIGLMAGICGRAYNVSATGLNQYVIVLAKTGVGKEGAASGIDKLLQHVRKAVPAVYDFVGPAEIASGQALIKYLQKHSCFVSIVGEFGLMLQQICSPAASASQVTLRKTLLSLYNKSGASDAQREIIYSDKEKNTQVIKSPAFSMLCESTPETFYVSLDETMIAQGLMPRFTCIEYLGNRPPLNPNHDTVVPSDRLIERCGELAANCLVLAQHARTLDVKLDLEAQKFADTFNIRCDNRINTSDMEVARQLWNRAHIKTLKLAALIAIGLNAIEPVISIEAIRWAADLVERDVTNVLKKFETGKAGRDTGELNQINELVSVISDYVRRPFIGLEKYKVDSRMHGEKVIEYGYMQRRCLQRGPYRNDRIGATSALKRSIEALTCEGSLRELKQLDVYQRYGKTSKCYIVIDLSRF